MKVYSKFSKSPKLESSKILFEDQAKASDNKILFEDQALDNLIV